METECGVESLLDLSHLTDDEQTAILQVLLRNAELCCQEQGRVSKLHYSVSDPHQLKSLSGEWFSDVRSKRYRKYGCDIVQASIRRKKKPKDTPLSVLAGGGVFDKQGEVNMQNGTPPNTRMRDETEGGDRSTAFPVPAPRSANANKRSPAIHNDTTDSTECVSEQNGLGKETAEKEQGTLQTPSPIIQVDLEKDSDSLSSSAPTEPDQTRLRASGSTSSLNLNNNTLSGSMMSLFSSGEFGMVDVRGTIQFSLQYDTKKEELLVRVGRCQDLALARKNRSDPYVKAYLLPDKTSQSKRKTAVKKKTVNPVFDETLKYKMRMSELKGRTLNLSVWHNDPVRRNIFLGEVEVALADWDWGLTEACWRPLLPRVQISQDTISCRGTLLLSLKFIPAGFEGSGLPLTGELHIWLREAQGLIPTKGGTVDSFIKSYVLPDESRSSRQKTRVVKNTVSPTFNHTMVYDGFQTVDLNEACAEITVWEKDTFSSQLLGGVRLSPGTGLSYGQPVLWMDSTEEETTVWTSMIQNPNTWVDAELPLRTNLADRKE
ncbi:hypothetical protein GJAV_G00096660 [Gymnothorax javanicus]|nr:hypothetical protein GJAV_G00096660 [Gymnothorax javanicus]